MSHLRQRGEKRNSHTSVKNLEPQDKGRTPNREEHCCYITTAKKLRRIFSKHDIPVHFKPTPWNNNWFIPRTNTKTQAKQCRTCGPMQQGVQRPMCRWHKTTSPQGHGSAEDMQPLPQVKTKQSGYFSLDDWESTQTLYSRQSQKLPNSATHYKKH